MLAGTVDALEGFFVQQAVHSMALRHLLHGFHGQLIMIRRNVGIAKDGCQFVLCGGNLVVFGFGQYAQFPQFIVEVPHKGGNFQLDAAKIVVLQFLAARRASTKQGAAGQHEVLTLIV